MYSVEAANIDKIAAMYAPSTKMGAIVGGQTSCKKPEIDALEKYIPADCDIVSCHSLHGPGTDTRDQPLVRPSTLPLLQIRYPILASPVQSSCLDLILIQLFPA